VDVCVFGRLGVIAPTPVSMGILLVDRTTRLGENTVFVVG
jgi:hypothetical protein